MLLALTSLALIARSEARATSMEFYHRSHARGSGAKIQGESGARCRSLTQNSVTSRDGGEYKIYRRSPPPLFIVPDFGNSCTGSSWVTDRPTHPHTHTHSTRARVYTYIATGKTADNSRQGRPYVRLCIRVSRRIHVTRTCVRTRVHTRARACRREGAGEGGEMGWRLLGVEECQRV